MVGAPPLTGAVAGVALSGFDRATPRDGGGAPWVAGWVVERAGVDRPEVDAPEIGPRWIADGGPDGEPCIEVTGSEGSYVIAHATPVPVEPGRRYVVSAWGFAQGHFARYCRRGPAVRWLAAGGQRLAEAAPPPRVLRGGGGAPVRGGFWAHGRFVAVVPPGSWQLTVSHGFDYEPADSRGAGESGAQVVCALHRWRDLRGSGWVSFEPHKHIAHGEQIIPGASFERAALGARADGVDAFFGAQHWGDVGDVGGRTRSARCAALCAPDLLVDWNTEIKRFPTGHSWEIGGGEYETELEAHGVPGQAVRANWEHHLAVRRRGGAVAFTHPNVGHNPATELPFCLFAGPTFDTLDVITGSRYDVRAQRNEQIWYWMLNRGYEIAATASTDGGLDREWASPIGGGRTYAFLGAEPLSVSALARAVRDGRTVASTGPMVLAMAAGQGPGARLTADGTAYQVRVEAWGGPGREGGLRRVELVGNGGVLARWTPAGQPKHFVADCPFVAAGAAWLVARAVGEDSAAAVARPLYFRPRGWQPPAPPPAKVTLDLEQSLRSSGGAVTVQVIAGDRALWARRVDAPQLRCDVPASTWFRTSAPGRPPVVTSVFYDCAPLRAACTHLGQALEQKARALATPELFERVRALLEDVRLTVPATAAEITPST